MGLLKTTEHKGYDAEYWRITQIVIDTLNQTVSVSLSLYKDKATRDTNEHAIILNIGLELDTLLDAQPQVVDNVKNINLQEAYKKLKENELFIDAQDA